MTSILKAQKANATKADSKGKRKADDMDVDQDIEVIAAKRKKNKQRVLLLSSRGITHRMRHLMNDLEALLPHVKKDSKLDSKSQLHLLPELADLNNCNNTLYFEARRHEDLYLWAAKTPNGPSIKMHVQNVHTMDELKMTGNCLKGSRDSKIWFRNFQIIEKDPLQPNGPPQTTLVEIGPRFVLTPIRIFEGAFSGATVFSNPGKVMYLLVRISDLSLLEFVSPSAVRSALRREKGHKYGQRKDAEEEGQRRKAMRMRGDDELAVHKVFA
ncbi:hypothetical protein C0989_008038 [Termitomyces sp. Mn162]|nr:hypothetical protein C0989_008038 [Termitomyces sp. Mn162]